MERVLGLDLGTNSVGWALLTYEDTAARPTVEAGVYVFPEGAEEEADGTRVSDRFKRGQTRRARRQLRRKRQRLHHVLAALVNSGLLPADPQERAQLMSSDRKGGERPYHPFVLRKKGLDQRLTPYEFGRCIYHIARRRGYLSTRDLIQRTFERRLRMEIQRQPHLDEGAAAEADESTEEPEQKEKTKLLERLAEARRRIEAGEARTIGELCANILTHPEQYPSGVRAGGKRKQPRTRKADPLGWRADRFLYEEEFDRLWEVQQRFHPTLLTARLRDSLRHMIFYQRPLMSKRGLIGGCEFFPQRKRLPRASLLHQRCSVLQELVNLHVSPGPGLPERRLRPDEIQILADELDKRDRLTWEEIKHLLNLPSDASFSKEPVTAGSRLAKGKSTRSTQGITGNRTAAVMRSVLGEDRWNGLSREQQEEIVNRLLYAFYPHNVIGGLVRDFGFHPDEVRALAAANLPGGYSRHCHRVWAALEPYMRTGFVYSEACVAAGFREPNESTDRPPDRIVERLSGLPYLNNPVVQQSVKMAFRVINAVIDRYGKPDRIHIEMPRDVSNTNAQREKIWRAQEERHRGRESAKRLLAENNLDLGKNEENVRKVLLWQEAGGRCPYQPDKEVTLVELVRDYTIDHIVPRSRSLDNSWMNLTICPMGENQSKGDCTPYEWLGKTERWNAIESYVRSLKGMPRPKRERILKKEWTADEFTNRALSDTRYISAVIKREVARLGVPVRVFPGLLTAEARRLWGLDECIPDVPDTESAPEESKRKPLKKHSKPRHDHRHHAVDALITALTDSGALQRLTAWYKAKETGANVRESPKPWPSIREDVVQLIERMPVVYAPNRTVQGALHEETARKPPPREDVARALAQLPPRKNGKPHRAVVVGNQLVRVRPDGTPFAAYDLGSNHHAVIWEKLEPERDGTHRREITVVSMIEAARRAAAGVPVFDRTPPREGLRYVMALCKDDLVAWSGENPGLYRVAVITAGEGCFEIQLRSPRAARAKGATRIRVRSIPALRSLAARVCLDPLGSVISAEPRLADHR